MLGQRTRIVAGNPKRGPLFVPHTSPDGHSPSDLCRAYCSLRIGIVLAIGGATREGAQKHQNTAEPAGSRSGPSSRSCSCSIHCPAPSSSGRRPISSLSRCPDAALLSVSLRPQTSNERQDRGAEAFVAIAGHHVSRVRDVDESACGTSDRNSRRLLRSERRSDRHAREAWESKAASEQPSMRSVNCAGSMVAIIQPGSQCQR